MLQIKEGLVPSFFCIIKYEAFHINKDQRLIMDVWLTDMNYSIPHRGFPSVTAKLELAASSQEEVRLLINYLEGFDINSLKPDYNLQKVAIEEAEAEAPEDEVIEKYTKNPIDSLEL